MPEENKSQAVEVKTSYQLKPTLRKNKEKLIRLMVCV